MELTDDQKKPLIFAMKLPSLKELARMRIARAIWSSEEVIYEFHRVQNTFDESTRKHFWPLEKKAKCQVSRLPLPARFVKEITPVINFIGGVLHRWIDLFEVTKEDPGTFEEWPDRIYIDYIVRDKLLWTAYGTLNYLNMAKSLLRDQTIPLKERFEIGCNFCSEEEIRRLCNELGPDRGSINVRLLLKASLHWYDTSLEDRHSNSIPELYSSPFEGFQHPYLWPRLSDDQRRKYLLHYIDWVEHLQLPYDDFFLFNKMDFEQQRKVLASRAWEVLQICLSRPWQHLFFDTFHAIKCHLDKEDAFSGFYDFLRTATLNECDDQFRDRFFAEAGPWIRKSFRDFDDHHLISALAFQVWAGNMNVVRDIPSLLPNLLRSEIILSAFQGVENGPPESVDRPAEVLERIRCLIEE